jgi:maltose/maltodextrin transport system permease protein
VQLRTLPAAKKTHWAKWPLTIVLALAGLWLVQGIYSVGQPMWALGVLVFLALAFYVYLADIAFAYRYLFPGLAGMAIFVAFPLIYTVHIGLTNYSSNNLLSEERAGAYLLDQTVADEAHALPYTLHEDGNEFRVVLTQESDGTRQYLVSPRLALRTKTTSAIAMQPLAAAGFTLNTPLNLKELLKHRDALLQLKLTLPDGSTLNYADVREFAPLNHLWQRDANGAMTELETGEVYKPNRDAGWFENAAGERIQPGFKVGIGLGNYVRMFSDPDFRGPFLSIFIWTIACAGFTVLFAMSIGIALAVVLNWESLRYRTVYRTLLFLPYAVPGFISILVFKGLFNQNFGEINAILNAVFHVKPAWFADPLLAKVMILIVNTWLGYPYFMLLCSGLLKAIPADLYEASAIVGARPLTNFFKITVPLIIKPLMPLVISAFAFNFNNFVLIALLTDGRPDYLNTKLPAGTTDILVSYTYRIAFQDSGQNYGLAAAISTVIFLMVAALSLAHLKIAKVHQDKK